MTDGPPVRRPGRRFASSRDGSRAPWVIRSANMGIRGGAIWRLLPMRDLVRVPMRDLVRGASLVPCQPGCPSSLNEGRGMNYYATEQLARQRHDEFSREASETSWFASHEANFPRANARRA